MSEYIKREDALNIIAITTMDNVADAPMFLRLIGNIPAADVEPVVRCAECVDCDAHTDQIGLWCKRHKFVVGSDFYCKSGAHMERSGSGE